MSIYYARHRRRRLPAILYLISQPLRLRGIIAVGAVTGLLLGLIAGFSLLA